MDTTSSLVSKDTRVRVSSVLNRDVKQFGKQFMFDGDDETCWNSDQGTPQWVLVDFPGPMSVTELQIKFQGGFVGKECFMEGCPPGEKDRKRITDFYPEDINSLQICRTADDIEYWLKPKAEGSTLYYAQ